MAEPDPVTVALACISALGLVGPDGLRAAKVILPTIRAAIDAAAEGQVAERFMDQSDVDRQAIAWIDLNAARLDGPHREIQVKHFERGDGALWLLWHNGKLAASASVVRDDANYSVLTRFAAPPVSASKPEETDRPFTRAQWFTLPIKLRDRWWSETDFGKRPPSPELTAAIVAALIPKEPAPKGDSA